MNKTFIVGLFLGSIQALTINQLAQQAVAQKKQIFVLNDMESCSFSADMDMHDLSIKQGDQNVTSDDFSNNKNVMLSQSSVPTSNFRLPMGNIQLVQVKESPQIYIANTEGATLTSEGGEILKEIKDEITDGLGESGQTLDTQLTNMLDGLNGDKVTEYVNRVQAAQSP